MVVPQGINSDQADANFVGHIENLLRSYTRRRMASPPFFSTTLGWLWGKSPDLRQRVLVVKTRVFSSPYSDDASSRAGREEGNKSQQRNARWHWTWCSTQRGLFSLCPSIFFKSSKVNNQHLVALRSCLML